MDTIHHSGGRRKQHDAGIVSIWPTAPAAVDSLGRTPGSASAAWKVLAGGGSPSAGAEERQLTHTASPVGPSPTPRLPRMAASVVIRSRRRPCLRRHIRGDTAMYRFALFVDGSNLFGALKAMNLEVHDYERFYSYLYREAQVVWHKV